MGKHSGPIPSLYVVLKVMFPKFHFPEASPSKPSTFQRSQSHFYPGHAFCSGSMSVKLCSLFFLFDFPTGKFPVLSRAQENRVGWNSGEGVSDCSEAAFWILHPSVYSSALLNMNSKSWIPWTLLTRAIWRWKGKYLVCHVALLPYCICCSVSLHQHVVYTLNINILLMSSLEGCYYVVFLYLTEKIWQQFHVFKWSFMFGLPFWKPIIFHHHLYLFVCVCKNVPALPHSQWHINNTFSTPHCSFMMRCLFLSACPWKVLEACEQKMTGGSESAAGDKDVPGRAAQVPVGWQRRVEDGAVAYIRYTALWQKQTIQTCHNNNLKSYNNNR